RTAGASQSGVVRIGRLAKLGAPEVGSQRSDPRLRRCGRKRPARMEGRRRKIAAETEAILSQEITDKRKGRLPKESSLCLRPGGSGDYVRVRWWRLSRRLCSRRD